MADRRTRVTLSIPWDDETEDHPAQWGYDVLLNRVRDVHVVDMHDLDRSDDGQWEVDEVTVAKPLGAIVSARLPQEIANSVFLEAEQKGVPPSAVLAAIIVAHFVDQEES